MQSIELLAAFSCFLPQGRGKWQEAKQLNAAELHIKVFLVRFFNWGTIPEIFFGAPHKKSLDYLGRAGVCGWLDILAAGFLLCDTSDYDIF